MECIVIRFGRFLWAIVFSHSYYCIFQRICIKPKEMFMSSDHIISYGHFILEIHNAIQALCTCSDHFLIRVTASILPNPYSGSNLFQDFISCDEVPRHMFMFFSFSCFRVPYLPAIYGSLNAERSQLRRQRLYCFMIS